MNMIDKMNMLSGLPRPNGNELTIKEKLEVKSMEQQERSVRQHEQAHLRSARDLTVGGASFDYKRGPDGTPAVGAYQSNIDPQENLHRILDLFA
ncbi:MAG: hypothetical protein GY950_07940 [bacterium]|nr:hypothetical protein [bacterium]